MDEFAALPVLALPEVAVSASVSDGRLPRVQEVRPEGQDVCRILDIEVGHRVLVEDLLHRGLQHGAFEGLIAHMLRAERLCEPIDDQAHVRADRVGNEDGFLAAGGSESLCNAGYGVRPAKLLPLALAALARPY